MSNLDRQAKLGEQIDIRIAVLEDMEKGLRSSDSCPTSLTKVREWEDCELSIERIGSPSSFVKTHRAYGKKIQRIESLIKRIRKPSTRKKPSKSAAASKARREKKEAIDSLSAAANQFVMLSEKIKQLESDLVLKGATDAGYQQEIEELNERLEKVQEENRLLRKEIARLNMKLSGSKITKIGFGKGKEDENR
ncbi:MAG: hypothetical protein ABW097_08795 [Candidatus Thiodiazotropha lotti]